MFLTSMVWSCPLCAFACSHR